MDYDFEYTYYAQNKKDVQAIKDKYTTESISSFSDEFKKLVNLDKSTDLTATIMTIFFVMSGFTVFLLGFFLFSTTQSTSIYYIGFILGIIGFIELVFSIPFNRYLKNKMKKKNASKIMDISDRILNEK